MVQLVRDLHTPGSNYSPESSQDHGPYVTVRDHEKAVRDHEKAISEMTLKHDKAVMNLRYEFEKATTEQKQSFDLAMAALRHELKRDADEKSMKHYLDVVNTKNEVKSLEERFDGKCKEQEQKIALHISKGENRRLKGFGWFFGASTAFLSRFSSLPDVIFENPKGSP